MRPGDAHKFLPLSFLSLRGGQDSYCSRERVCLLFPPVPSLHPRACPLLLVEGLTGCDPHPLVGQAVRSSAIIDIITSAEGMAVETEAM